MMVSIKMNISTTPKIRKIIFLIDGMEYITVIENPDLHNRMTHKKGHPGDTIEVPLPSMVDNEMTDHFDTLVNYYRSSVKPPLRLSEEYSEYMI